MSKTNGKQKGKDITTAVNELCQWFPDPQGVISHGSPDLRVAGKRFATNVINHHGVDQNMSLGWSRIADLVQQIAQWCLALPETSRDQQFGNPCFRAGKKNFCTVYISKSRLQLSTWAGSEAQASLTFDNRYQIPPYTGHNGWLNLDIEDGLMAGETEMLIEQSYRHFALQRMLKALDA